MALSKRAIALARIKYAGYHDDRAQFTRLYIESRVSLQSAQTAYRAGRDARAAGVKCTCPECNPQAGK